MNGIGDKTFPSDFLTLDHSFGYDCTRLYNLCVLEGPVLVYITGRFLHFYDLETGKVEYRRSSSPEGIGQITAHHTEPLLAVGEKGDNPPVIIYDWPSMREVMVLRGGARRSYSHLSYNTAGDLLASQASSPDFSLTLWSWKKGEILLQTKSFDQTVNSVAFSAFNSDQLASCGEAHLKFWRMSKTFTGLKLQGQLGRFGKTETCDLLGVLPLPDGSCATGSSWGNVLIWQEGVVRLEVFRVGRLPCHQAAITQLLYHNQTLLSAGMDGAVRVWNYETIEMADPAEDDPHVEMEPLFEFIIEEGDVMAQLLSLTKYRLDPSDTLWFAQGRDGAVWRMEISMNVNADAPRRVFWCHAGSVAAVQASPAATLLATVGADRKLLVFDYTTKNLQAFREFNSAGTCLLWLPPTVAPCGRVLIAGFFNGVLRVIVLTETSINLIQATKPHNGPIVSIALGPDLVVSASLDGTAFIFRIIKTKSLVQLQPIGFCQTQYQSTCLAWSTGLSFLVGCENGKILKFSIPENLENYRKKKSFFLDLDAETLNSSDFVDDLEDQAELSLGPIHFLWSAPTGSVWFSRSFDPQGSIYQYSFTDKKLVGKIDGALTPNSTIESFYFWAEAKCLFFGLIDGRIQAVKLNDDFEIIDRGWDCGFHDSEQGAIRQLTTSWDGCHLFSCGHDGAVFSYNINNPRDFVKKYQPRLSTLEKYETVEDIEEPSLSLEETKIKENLDQRADLANKRKNEVKEAISALKAEYWAILQANDNLPVEIKLGADELVPDQRVVEDFKKSLVDEKALVYRKIARDAERSSLLLKKLRGYFLDEVETLVTKVEAIESDTFVETFLVVKLGDVFYTNLASVRKKMEEQEDRGSLQSAPQPPEVVPAQRPESPDPVEGLIKQVGALGDISRNRKLTALREQHRVRREATASRKLAWDELMLRAPDPTRSDPKDLSAIEQARETLGDYKLKTSADYKVPKHLNVTTLSKYKVLLEARQRVYEMKHNFNNKVLALRDKKQSIISKHSSQRATLERIAEEIEREQRLEPPDMPSVKMELEFPEKRFVIEEQDILNALPPGIIQVDEPPKETDLQIDLEYIILAGAKDKKPYLGNDVLKISEMQKLAEDDTVETPWESEMRQKRLLRRLEEQKNIVTEMEKSIVDFDKEIFDLSTEKINLEVDAKFLDLHILTLNQEILVLKTFEKEEHEKANISFELLKSKQDLQNTMNDVMNKMEKIVNDIKIDEEEAKELVTTFLATIAENKYYDFLKKIFKKKYRPAKIKTDDSEDSLSSDSETDSSEEDGKSLDSHEYQMVRMNENICPEDCDQSLYDKTFETRAARYELELSIADKRKDVELLKKNFNGLAKQAAKVDVDFAIAQKDFEDLQREKQLELNKIETIAVLRLSQFQNFKDDISLNSMEDSLVLSADLLTQLYNRIGELTRETKQQKERHEQNKQHLQRMSIDIRYMADSVLKLEQEIEEAMFKKFGSKVDLDELDEALVKKLVSEMNYAAFELQEKLDRKLLSTQEKLQERVDIYVARLSENTKRYNILTLLQDEKNKLEEALHRQEVKKSEAPRAVDPCDLERLNLTVRKLESHAARMRAEVDCLKYKTRPIPPPGEFAEAPREMVQTALMKGSNGEYHEVSFSVRNRLQEIAVDVEELVAEIQTECGSPDNVYRLKKLVEEFMDEIPEAALRAMWIKLADGRDAELGCMLESPATLLEASEMILQMVSSILPPYTDDTENCANNQEMGHNEIATEDE